MSAPAIEQPPEGWAQAVSVPSRVPAAAVPASGVRTKGALAVVARPGAAVRPKTPSASPRFVTSTNWTRGEVIAIDGVRYRVRGRTKSGDINVEHVAEQRFETRTEAELVELWEQGVLERIPDPEGVLGPNVDININDLPLSMRQEALRKYEYVKAFLSRGERRQSAKVLAPIIAEVAKSLGDEKPPSVRTLQRDLNRWFSVGAQDCRDLRILVARRGTQGNREPRLQPEVADIAEQVVNSEALKRPRMPGPQIQSTINARVKAANELRGAEAQLKDISLATVYRMLNAIDREVVVLGQEGRLAANRGFAGVTPGPQGDGPLSDVEVDHTTLDVLVICSVTRSVIGRPTITVALDRYTRMIVGLYIGFRPPSFRTVASCLRVAISPKNWVKERHTGVENEWPVFGKPTRLHVDNGPDFHSQSLLDACVQLKIELVHGPRKQPHFKGKIERWFRTVSRSLIHTLPGTTYSNPQARGDYDSAGEAAVTLDDLRALILKWIIDVYHVEIHHTTGEAPLERWQRSVASNPVSLPPRLGDLDVFLDEVEYRKLSRKGIQFQGLLFNCRELRPLLSSPDLPPVCKVKVDPADLSHVKLEDFRTRRWIAVPSVDPKYTDGLTLDQHGYLSAFVKERQKKYKQVTIGALIDARESIRLQIAELVRNNKGFSKAMHRRFADEGSLEVFGPVIDGEAREVGGSPPTAGPAPQTAVPAAVPLLVGPAVAPIPVPAAGAALTLEEKRARLARAAVSSTQFNPGA